MKKVLAWSAGILVALFVLGALLSQNPSDTDDIATKIKAQLFSDPDLKALNVNVSEDRNEITLSGVVPDQSVRLKVYKIAAASAGSKRINDQTRVLAASNEGQDQLTAGSEGALLARQKQEQKVSEPPVEPETVDVTLMPYDLTKNPFKYRNKIITLHPEPTALDPVASYQIYGGNTLYPAIALKFNRMLDADTGLYDIGSPLPIPQAPIVGQILVSGSSDALDVRRDWQVEPQGTEEGTNGLGALIAVPLVKFRKYSTPQENQDQEPARPQREMSASPPDPVDGLGNAVK